MRRAVPGDSYALVLHERQADELGVGPGDWVLVSIPDPTGERRWASQERWQVVGVLIDITTAGSALVPRETLFDLLGSRGVNRVQLQSSDGSPAGTADLAARARAFYERQDIDVQVSDSPTVTQRSSVLEARIPTRLRDQSMSPWSMLTASPMRRPEPKRKRAMGSTHVPVTASRMRAASSVPTTRGRRLGTGGASTLAAGLSGSCSGTAAARARRRVPSTLPTVDGDKVLADPPLLRGIGLPDRTAFLGFVARPSTHSST